MRDAEAENSNPANFTTKARSSATRNRRRKQTFSLRTFSLRRTTMASLLNMFRWVLGGDRDLDPILSRLQSNLKDLQDDPLESRRGHLSEDVTALIREAFNSLHNVRPEAFPKALVESDGDFLKVAKMAKACGFGKKLHLDSSTVPMDEGAKGIVTRVTPEHGNILKTFEKNIKGRTVTLTEVVPYLSELPGVSCGRLFKSSSSSFLVATFFLLFPVPSSLSRFSCCSCCRLALLFLLSSCLVVSAVRFLCCIVS